MWEEYSAFGNSFPLRCPSYATHATKKKSVLPHLKPQDLWLCASLLFPVGLAVTFSGVYLLNNSSFLSYDDSDDDVVKKI